MTRRALAIMLVGMVACRPPGPNGPALRSPNPSAQPNALEVETVAQGLEHPWALAFLPDRRILATERPGRLRIVEPDGRLSPPLSGVPAVYARGQGGLLDVALDPAFSNNQIIYLSYAEPGAGGLAGTAVARARLGTTGLESVQVIYRQEPKVSGGGHFGSRLVFDRSGALFITQGDRFDYRDQAQNLSSGLGKIVRIMPDGSIPRDNPYAGRSGTRPEIWSSGHRNVQAATLDPATGQLWTVEHGARGGDELNHPEAGKNYGWPVITYGRDYSGLAIGEGTAKEGMEQPVYYWDPIIAPSGMVFYTGDRFPDWKGNILVGGLASQVLVRLVLENGVVIREERYLGELGWRIRDVQEGPDGALYVVTDEADGRVLRILPRSR